MHETQSRRQLQQKQAFHNIMINIPYFISLQPTTIVAVSRNSQQVKSHTHQYKLYFSQNHFRKIPIIFFNSLQQSSSFVQKYREDKNNWCQYCKDVQKLSGIFYQSGKIYVPHLNNPTLRQFISDVSQMVVLDGVRAEQAMKRSGSNMFLFLDENTVSLEHIFYRWRVYSYLMGDGDKKYTNQPFKMITEGSEWYPPVPSSIHPSLLSHSQRRHLSTLLVNLTRKKQSIEEAMVFCIHNIQAALQIVTTIVLQILEKLDKDYIKYFYLISDILFNTTTQNYRRLFARMIPFLVFYIAGRREEEQNRRKGELKALIQIWEIKFIFEDNYTKGLTFLIDAVENGARQVQGLHFKLKEIGEIQDQRESQLELQKICFCNGIPLFYSEKEECTRIVNQYLWKFYKEQDMQPKISENYDGQPLSQKDLMKIKAKQVKLITSENLSINLLLQKSWQTKSKLQSRSIDSS